MLPNYEAGFSKLVNLFFFYLLDKIVLNTNSYALIKGADLAGRQWENVDHKELILDCSCHLPEGFWG